MRREIINKKILWKVKIKTTILTKIYKKIKKNFQNILRKICTKPGIKFKKNSRRVYENYQKFEK